MDDELKRHIAELEGKVRTLRELNGHLMLERDDAIDVAMNTENENDTLRARIAELEARWAEVPWALIDGLYTDHAYTTESTEPMAWPYLPVFEWLAANAPKEPQP